MKVKKNDEVIILTGKDRGLKGEVIEVDPKKSRVKVARRNMVVKHKSPNPLTGESGARVEEEGWIDASNVALFSEERGGPVRVGYKFVGKGGELFDVKKAALESYGDETPERIQKVRYGKQTGEVFDNVEAS
jgi:large subunit ribosomal protein L24